MVARYFAADYPGRCGACDEPFPAGMRIRFDAGRIVADHGCVHEMPTEEEQEAARAGMCSKCFIVHAPGQKECE